MTQRSGVFTGSFEEFMEFAKKNIAEMEEHEGSEDSKEEKEEADDRSFVESLKKVMSKGSKSEEKEENWDDISAEIKEMMKPAIDKAALVLFKENSEAELRIIQGMKGPARGMMDIIGGKEFKYFHAQVYQRAYEFFAVYNENKRK